MDAAEGGTYGLQTGSSGGGGGMSFSQHPTYKLHFSAFLLLTVSMVAAKGGLGDAEDSPVLKFLSAGGEWHSERLDENSAGVLKRAGFRFCLWVTRWMPTLPGLVTCRVWG